MAKINEALEILLQLGLPGAQQNERSALTLLALAHMGPSDKWIKTQKPLLRIVDIMNFMRDEYKKDYAPNSRETIRRQTIHQFEQARIINRNPDDPQRPTNSGKTVYCLTDEILLVLKVFGTSKFDDLLDKLVAKIGSLEKEYRSSRAQHKIPLKTPNGEVFYLSPGKHNILQAAVVSEFGPRFAPNATVLYIGDTEAKHVICNKSELALTGFPITEHDKLPDIILYLKSKNWLFLVEAVTSHGPVSPKRYKEIEEMCSNCSCDRIYVTAFPDSATFRKYACDIAWETEVWIAEQPDHMIHFNGTKFIGPYKKR